MLAELNAEHRVTILLATHSEDAAPRGPRGAPPEGRRIRGRDCRPRPPMNPHGRSARALARLAPADRDYGRSVVTILGVALGVAVALAIGLANEGS